MHGFSSHNTVWLDLLSIEKGKQLAGSHGEQYVVWETKTSAARSMLINLIDMVFPGISDQHETLQWVLTKH